MEQFKIRKIPSLSDFQGLLFVFECVVVIITQKEIHTLQGYRPSLWWNFQYRELKIMPV